MTQGRGQLAMRVAKIAAVSVVGLIVAAKVVPTASPPIYHAVGEPMEPPAESLTPVSGSEFDGILVGLRGAPVVVNIWASWCAPCRTEMPLLERAARRFEGRVAFVGVASRDDRDEALRFLEGIGLSAAARWAPVEQYRRADLLDKPYWSLIAGVLVLDGLRERQVPIGVLDGASMALLGVAIFQRRSAPSVQRVLVAVGGVAVVRSAASIWLPRLGEGLTHPHIESIVVSVVAAVCRAWSLRRRHEVARPQSGPTHDA